MKPILFLLLLIAVSSKTPIPELVRTVNDMKTTWKAQEYTRDITPLLGELIDTPNPNPLPERIPEVNDELPESFDLREKYPECKSISEIRDQANCGSCWAFGAVEVMTDRLCIHSGQKDHRKLSAQDLVSCCSTCGFGCQGGWSSAAFFYWRQYGVVTGGEKGETDSCYPYFLPHCDHHVQGKYGPCPATTKAPSCANKCQEEYSKEWSEDKVYGSEAYSLSGEKRMMQELYERGSMAGSFTVYEDFPTYKSGVYQHVAGKALGGHAIKILGWGVENGVKYWLCANSWNEQWGDNGYFKILRGSNHCGIESGPSAGMPKL